MNWKNKLFIKRVVGWGSLVSFGSMCLWSISSINTFVSEVKVDKNGFMNGALYDANGNCVQGCWTPATYYHGFSIFGGVVATIFTVVGIIGILNAIYERRHPTYA